MKKKMKYSMLGFRSSKDSCKKSTYISWFAMKQRCLNKKHGSYINYGGRGIMICERWMIFENFLFDMGVKPDKKLTLDRINNSGHYNPTNCRWATRKEQQANVRHRQSRPKGFYKDYRKKKTKINVQFDYDTLEKLNKIKSQKGGYLKTIIEEIVKKNI